MVDELLVLSRAEDRELQGERVDLPDAVRRSVERWRAAAEARQIALSRPASARARPGARAPTSTGRWTC